MKARRAGKKNRSLWMLLGFGILITLFSSLMGGYLLYAGYTKAPTATQPIWKLGQWMLFSGVVNLFVYLAVAVVTRRSPRGEAPKLPGEGAPEP